MFRLNSKFPHGRTISQDSQSSASSDGTMRYKYEISERQQIQDLEAQLKQLSNTAASALDRVSQLEDEIHGMTSSSSNSSLSSLKTGEDDRLEVLEAAIHAIHRARLELSAPHNYRYI